MKIKLTPVERDLLCLLEEAGSEEFATLLVSLPDFTEVEVRSARDSLKRMGFLDEDSGEVILTEAGRESLSR